MRSQRLLQVLGMVQEAGQVSVEQVSARLHVSAATVRRDLNALAERRLVLRTHGGAAAAGSGYEVPLGTGSTRRGRGEQAMARAVAGLVRAGDVVGLAGGPTTAAVARQLACAEHLAPGDGAPGDGGPGDGGPVLTVVTNALDVAHALCARPHVRLVVTGGAVLPGSYQLAGPAACRAVEQLVLDVAVLGADGVSARFGVTAAGPEQAEVARALAGAAKRVVVVAGAVTLSVEAPARLLGLSGVDVLVTDEEPGGALPAGLDRADVEVVVARR